MIPRICADSAVCAKINLENNCKFSSLQESSLRDRTGNQFATTGKQFRLIRAGTGNRREIDTLAAMKHSTLLKRAPGRQAESSASARGGGKERGTLTGADAATVRSPASRRLSATPGRASPAQASRNLASQVETAPSC